MKPGEFSLMKMVGMNLKAIVTHTNRVIAAL